MLQDAFNRQHNYLRISLTNNCNLRCAYCMPEEDYVHTPAASLMQTEEIISLAKIFVDMGVTKIRLTGGEPLVRKDAAYIIQELSALPVELTLTTNATRIHHFLPVIKKAHIKTINVSLDTLQPEKYFLLTRRDVFKTVWENIQQLINAGIQVKVNMVVMKNYNTREITDFIEWTKSVKVNIRFIEFMPFDGNRWSSDKVFTQAQILTLIGSQYTLLPVAGAPHDTARHYCIPGHAGSFSVISSMSAPFCSTCNRMRLTADGKMKNCLFASGETDLLQALRNGENVKLLVRESLQQKFKERGGQFEQGFEAVENKQLMNRSMIAIGG